MNSTYHCSPACGWCGGCEPEYAEEEEEWTTIAGHVVVKFSRAYDLLRAGEIDRAKVADGYVEHLDSK